MIWMDECFLHDGSIGSLEEMFNPDRLKPGVPFLELGADYEAARRRRPHFWLEPRAC